VDTERGWLYRGPEQEWIAAVNCPCVAGWTPGRDNIRVIYTAGFLDGAGERSGSVRRVGASLILASATPSSPAPSTPTAPPAATRRSSLASPAALRGTSPTARPLPSPPVGGR